MAEQTDARSIATAWTPQRPGRRSIHAIPDALVEPEWGGARAVAALTHERAEVFARDREVRVPEELGRALLDGFRAVEAVVEGHLTTLALQTGEGAFPEPPTYERFAAFVPRLFRRGGRHEARMVDAERSAEATAAEQKTLDALEGGERHAFVATDLLWLDGQALLDVPLLERKRLLDGVLEESFLVRVGAFVRPSAVSTLVAWGTLGFRALSYRAANSRYLPGEANGDWTIAPPPDGSTRRSAPSGGPG